MPNEESFLIPLKYSDVTRTTDTMLDVMLEKISTIIGTLIEMENCQIRGQVPHGSLYWMKSWEETDNKAHDFHTSHFVAIDWKGMSDASKR